MVSASFGPCSDWETYWTCDPSSYSPVLTGYAATFATRTLWALSGRRFGTCTVTLRPCRYDCMENWNAYPLWDWPTGYSMPPWDWYTVPYSCGSCPGNCSCGSLSEVILPSPVNTVVSVKMDGTPMVTGGSAYRVDDNRFLVRTDGAAWPRCNDLTLDDTHAGTWSVTAAYGEDIPDSARLAMGELTCEILKASSGEDCRLPPGVTQLVREGVTIQYPDVGQLLKEGRTGLYLTDLFLSTENPEGHRQRARVYGVDRPRHRRTGT